MADYLNEALNKIEEFEAAIPWMYRDAAGRVTAGVGLQLADAEAATRLPFLVDGRAATAEEVTAEFARVDALPAGRPAQFYRREGGPELTAALMNKLLRAVVEGVAAELAGRINGFIAMPDPAKMALLDLAYGLGADGLLGSCPELVRAAEAGAWRMAAAKSFRPGAGAARNQWTRTMLRQAAPGAGSESRIKRLGFGVLGMVASWVGK